MVHINIFLHYKLPIFGSDGKFASTKFNSSSFKFALPWELGVHVNYKIGFVIQTINSLSYNYKLIRMCICRTFTRA